MSAFQEVCICSYIWDSFHENVPSHNIHNYYIIFQCYKNESHLNRYNFRTVKAINVLFSTHHSTPFLYVKIYFSVLHQHSADVSGSDTPWGSKPPHLRVGEFKSFKYLCVGQRCPAAIEQFCSLHFTLQLCNVYAYFPLDSHHCCMQPAFHSPNP